MTSESRQFDEYLNSAEQNLQFGMNELALHWFEQAIALDSESIEAWTGKAEALRRLGRYEEAIRADETAIALQMNSIKFDAKFWFQKGINQDESGDFEGAIASYDQALRYEEAIASYEALHYKQNVYRAWFNRGIALHNLGRHEEAIASYDEALHYKPDDYNAWSNRGFVFGYLGRHEEAIISYDEALRYKPDLYQAWNNRGSSLNDLGQYEQAIANYEEALRYKSDFHQAWNNRGNTLSNLRRYEDAIANYDRGLIYVLKEANPEGWGMLHRGKGNIYFYQAQRSQNIQAAKIYYGQAITTYNIARPTLELSPESYLKLIQNLIKAHLGLGNSEAANQWRITGLEVFRQLLNAQPTPFLKRKLETKFSGFSRIEIDSLIAQGEIIIALETAERYKNRCLTWILDEWKEQIYSLSYAEMRQLLNPQTAIVYWHLSDDSFTTFILTPTSEDPILLENALPYDRYQKLQSWIKTWNTQYNDYRIKKENQSDHPWRRNLTTQLAKLKEILQISAIESYLSNIQNLTLLPHRDLHRFPLHALFSEIFAISYLPSIQIGLTLQKKPRSADFKLLSVEDPKTDRPQMPYAQLESALCCYLFPDHTQLDETKATAENVIRALSDRYTHFHFTGHAGYNIPPENSALILTNDEPLTAKTIRHLDLTAYELITLSACETALTGNQSIDTEFVGLVSAFLQAGATAVLSTLWNINEISNTWLILKFYELYPQVPPAQALKSAQTWLRSLTYEALLQWLDRTAQLPPDHAYRQDLQDEITLIQKNLTEHKIELHQTPYSDPYHWAAFTLTGGVL